MKGKIKGEDVVVLIDCGATHNFIAEKLVTALDIPTKGTANYRVILGSGTTVKGKGICGRLEVMVGEWKIIDSFLPLELGGVDVVPVTQWLHSLGVAKVDWRNLVMSFLHEGRKIVIKGDPNLTKKRVSLKNMMKMWGAEV